MTDAGPIARLPERFRFSREVYGDVVDDATRVHGPDWPAHLADVIRAWLRGEGR